MPKQRLEAELALLSERLNDAEDMCRAIANGEVDGFVVGAEEARKQVLLLSHAYQRYRQLIERMQHGAVTVSPAGDVLYASSRFADLVGEPLNRLLGARLQAFVDPRDMPALNRLLVPGNDHAELAVRLRRSDGRVMEAHLVLASFSDGYASILVIDLSPQLRLEHAEETVDAIRGGGVDAVVVNDERVVMLGDEERRLQAVAPVAHEMDRQLAPIHEAAARLGKARLDEEARAALRVIARHAGAVQRLVLRLLSLAD